MSGHWGAFGDVDVAAAERVHLVMDANGATPPRHHRMLHPTTRTAMRIGSLFSGAAGLDRAVERVFGGRTDADSSCDGWDEGRPESAIIGGSDAALSGDGPVELLPTPAARDCKGHGPAGMRRNSPKMSAIADLLPTPRTSDTNGAGGMDLRTTIGELVKENMYGDETAPGSGSVLGEGGKDRHLLAVDCREGEQVRAREVHAGSEESQSASLGIRESGRPNTGGANHRPPVSGACLCESSPPGAGNHGGEPASSGCGENSLPTASSIVGEQRAPGLKRTPALPHLPERSLAEAPCSQVWGKYGPAIARWEHLTRPAPAPTEPNKNGNPRLSAAFSEWLMGWPDGWVTQVPGISRNDQLRIIGNGVVSQCAEAALRYLLSVTEVAA